MSDADDVIRLYCDHYFEKRKRRPNRPARRDPSDIEIALRYLSWCGEHMVDYEEMLDLRFEHLWKIKRICPRFNALRAPTLIPFAQKREASNVAAATQVEAFDQAVRSLTVMTPGHEQVRQRYFMQRQSMLCIENGMNGGYDPRSRYCPHCPQAAECEKRLNSKWGFNVSALRAGKIHLLPAPVRSVLRGWDGSLSV